MIAIKFFFRRSTVRDSESIKRSVQSDSQFYNFREFDNCVNAGLARLWNNEDVTHAVVFSFDGNAASILLITNQNRMIVCNESKEEIKGFLIDRTRYNHSVYVYDMTGVDANKTRCVERSSGGFFSRTYYDVVFEGQSNPPRLTITCDKKDKAFKIKDLVLSAFSRPAATASATTVSSPASAAPPTSSAASEIAEIRKMYEDGIIDKAEMLDLIKALKK